MPARLDRDAPIGGGIASLIEPWRFARITWIFLSQGAGTYLRARFQAARLHPLRCWERARKYVPAQLDRDAPLCGGIASLIEPWHFE